MTKTTFGFGTLLLAVFCLTVAWATADQDESRGERGAVRDANVAESDDRPRLIDRNRGPRNDAGRPRIVDVTRSARQIRDERADDSHEVASLGKTIKLTFTIQNDEGEPSFSVLCAKRSFRISHDASEPDFEHSLSFSGELFPVDDEGRIGVAFEAQTRHHNLVEGFEGVFATKGSAILQLDKKTTLGQLGDEPLTLTATVVE